MNDYLGLIDRFKMDLNRIGLTGQELVFGDDTTGILPDDKGKLQKVILEKGEPRGITIKNPLNPASIPIFVPFNANPQEIQEAIRQANGMRVGNYATGRRNRQNQMISSRYTSETAGFGGFDTARTGRNNQYNSQ